MRSARENQVLKLLPGMNCSKAHTNNKIISMTGGKHSFHISRLWYSSFFSLYVIAPNTSVSPTTNAKKEFVVQEIEKTLLYSLLNITFYL
jgi:hypothetical protein